MKNWIKRAPGVCFGIMTIIAFLLILFTMVVFGWHTMLLNNEESLLRNTGYWSQKDVGEYKLNTYVTGNRVAGHKIIGISGMGIDDYPIGMYFVNNELKTDNLLVYIDRAGYGVSEDTTTPQTVERVVEDYRQVLIDMRIEGPYVLMPHSLGSVYATYWAMKYPDEIEAVVYIDGTTVIEDAIEESNIKVKKEQNLIELGQLGFYRLSSEAYIDKLPSNYPSSEIEASAAAQLRNVASMAKLSESVERNNNIRKTIEIITPTETPKLYISSSLGFTTREEVKQYFEWEYNKAVKVSYTDERADKFIAQCAEYKASTIDVFVEAIGNTEIVMLPGDHCIYLERPTELANIIKDFLHKLPNEET